MATINDCAYLARFVYDTKSSSNELHSKEDGTWILNANVNLERTLMIETGTPIVLQAWTLLDECIVATRGTDPSNAQDLTDDARLTFKRALNRVQTAQLILKLVANYREALNFKHVIFTGHSLGGYLAQALAVRAASNGHFTSKFVAFNAPGIDASSRDQAKGVNIWASADIVRRFGGNHVGYDYTISNINAVSAHSIDRLKSLVMKDRIGRLDVDQAISLARRTGKSSVKLA